MPRKKRTEPRRGNAGRSDPSQESLGETHCLHDPAAEYVWELVRTGLMLHGLLCNLFEDLPEDAFPGENSGEVLIEMLTGTMRPALAQAGEHLVREATALLKAGSQRVIEDLEAGLVLRLALERGSVGQG